MSANLLVLLLCVPLAAAAAGWAAERIGIPYPVLLVIAGALLALLPWLRPLELSPEVVFYVFLPPLIYYAAYFIAPEDLRANARTIGLLAVGLVVTTMAAVAGVMVWAAGVPLAVAAVAGAVVAPTDPVAATSVFRRLSMPERLVTIVEGEGLINDGTALVLYVGAVGTAVAGKLRLDDLAVALVAEPLGGTVLGLGIAWAVLRMRRRIDQPLVEITLSLTTPYLTYVIAQAAGLSGILATVAAGVYVGSRAGSIYAPGARLQAFAFLDVLVFLLNAVLFTLVGMQLVLAVHRVPGMAIVKVVGVTVAVVAAVVTLRMVWMLLGPTARRLRRNADSPAMWHERVVIGWAGMRGGVSLAAALAVPLRRADGVPLPYRDLVITVAAAVIVVTLVAQSMTLPWLLSKLGIRREDVRDQEQLARVEAVRAALARLDEHVSADGADSAIESLRALYTARARRLEVADQDRPSPAPSRKQGPQRYRTLRLELLDEERSVVLGLRQQGRISAAVYRTVERSLDLEEARLRGL